MKKCPYCREEIQDEAIKCKHCGSMLAEKQQWYFKTSTLVIAFLCFGPFALPLVWFNRRLSARTKIIISAIIIILSFYLGFLVFYSLSPIIKNYKLFFQGYF